MMAHYFALIRHGAYHQRADTPSALQPYTLTEQGVEQAQACAGLLIAAAENLNLSLSSHFHCSSLLRAWQTADTIAKQLPQQIDIVEHDELVERNVGSMANLTIAEIESILLDDPRYGWPPANWKADSDYRLPFPGAESLMDAGRRVLQCIETICETEIAETLVPIVGHGAAIRHAAYHMGILEPEELPALSMYHATPIVIQYTNGKWTQLSGAWKARQQESTD